MNKKTIPASFEKSPADKEKKGQKEGSKTEKASDLKQMYGPNAPHPGFPAKATQKKKGK